MVPNRLFSRLRGYVQTLLLAGLGAVLILAGSGQGVAQSEYRLGQGDVLRFEVLEDPNLNRSLLVAPDGRISVPLVGNVRVGGRNLEQVQADLTQRLAPNFAAPPTVFVSLERRAEPRPAQPAAPQVIEIFIMGEARNPGRLEVRPDTTVLQLFAQMGGFTNFAATKRIQLRRGEQIWAISYPDIESGASNAGAIRLADGDVIVIPQRRLFE